jgi:parvulin-like peptidyl-prolyl isomerase
MKAENPTPGGSRNVIVLTVLVVVVIGIITAVLIYANKVAPFQTIVLEVNDASIKMRYFLKRVSLANATPDSMFQTLATEEIIKQIAPQMPYGIKVTEEDIDQYIRTIPAGENETISENDFESWYRQELKKTGLSKAEYRDIVLINLLGSRLSLYLSERIPTVAPQVHLYTITQESADDIANVKQRLDAGEDFLGLAQELRLDDPTNSQEPDLGWFTRSVLPEDVAQLAFDVLDVGQYSEPMFANQQYYAIVMVAERAAAMQVDEQTIEILRSNVLDGWLQQEMPYHKIAVHGLSNGYDRETEAWVQWQLQKSR